MRTLPPIASLLALSFLFPIAIGQETKPAPTVPTGRDAGVEPAYDSAGRLQPPLKYREWMYLTSGIDMSYNPKPEMDGMSMFDNVFVNPAAYRAFVATGTWPDKTMLVLESRGAQGPSSINKKGHSQSPEIMGFEVHVRDEAKNPGGWAFCIRQRQAGGTDSRRGGLLFVPSGACGGCYDLRAVLSDVAADRYGEEDAQRRIPERVRSRPAEISD